jgi:hypothetical protein
MSDDTSTIEQIWAMQPEGQVGGDIFPYNDVSEYMRVLGYDAASVEGGVDFLDMLEEANAQNEDEFRMKGVTDGPTLGEAEEALKAAAKQLADWQAMKGGAYGANSSGKVGDQADQYFTTQAELQDKLQDTRDTYVALGGDPDPSFLSRLGQGAIDLVGAGGQAFSDIITGGTGPDVAQTLIDPIAPFLGGFGGKISWGDSGNSTPLILGKTSATGMPVGLTLPDPRTIAEEGFFPWLVNNAGLGGPATAAVTGAIASNALDTTNETGAGVGLSGASLIAAAAALDKDNDAVKTGAVVPAAEGVGPDSPAIKTDVRDIIAGGVDSDIPAIKTGARDIIAGGVSSDSPVIKTGLAPDVPTIKTGGNPDSPVIKTGPMPDAELDKILTGGKPAVDGGYDTPPIKTSPPIKTGGGGGGGGGGGTPSGGTRTVSGGPGDLVDIDYLFDFAKGLEQPFQTTEEDEDIVRAAEGGMIGNTNDFERILRIVRGI